MSEFNPSPEFEEKIRKAVKTPDARPEFINQLKNKLARGPVKMKPRFVLKPAWAAAFALAALALIAAAPGAVNALKRLFGYVPGVGLVENAGNVRVLERSASVTREGVTLTVTQALVYPDHVQLVYEVSGIAPENDGNFAEDSATNYSAFCGSPDGDAKLRLPDGTIVERVFGSDKYPENVFAMKPAYEISISADVTELTMVLKCIPWSRLGAVPENWEVPLRLKYVPADTVIGEPVLDVTPSGTSSVHADGITVSLAKVVPQNDLYSFYVTIVPDEKKESLAALYPASAYLTDATGQKAPLIYNHPFSGYQDTAEPWELQSVSKPAYGPYLLTVDKIFAHYSEDGSEFFEFNAGDNPQTGQTWEINQVLHLAGADVRVLSATVVEKDLSMWGMSANAQGFGFSFEAVDGVTPFALDIMDRDLNHIADGMIAPFSENGEPAAKVVIVLFYEKGVPSGVIPVAVNGQKIMLTGKWQIEWASPDQTGVTLLDSAQAVSSAQTPSNASASLKRVVRLDEGYLFYVDMQAIEDRPDLRVVAPESVSVIDSTGQQFELQLNGPQVNVAANEHVWEFSTKEKLADGPMKIVIQNAKAYYNPWDVSVPPPADMVAAQSFTFDAGTEPQVGQTWNLDYEFELGGYTGKIASVRAVTVDSNLLPFPELRPDASINRGYEFTIQSIDPAVRWNVGMFISRAQGFEDAGFVDCIGYLNGEPGATTTRTVTCRGLPASMLNVTVHEVSILLDGVWEMNWIP